MIIAAPLNGKEPMFFVFEVVVRPEGFEPPTLWFVAKYSIQLSYGRIIDTIVTWEGVIR